MKATILAVTPFQQNCSLLVCEETNRAAVVDPGGDVDQILEAVEQSGATVEKILLTHAHIDHCGGTAELADRLGVPVEGPHLDDKFWIDALPQQAQMFGLRPARPFTPKRWLVGGDTVRFGNVKMEVRHVPGHTPGHVIFYSPADKLAITGDVLFAGSIGRTDLPRGDYDTLIRSIKAELWPLGDDVTFLPGHGPASTFGEERQSNPYVAD